MLRVVSKNKAKNEKNPGHNKNNWPQINVIARQPNPEGIMGRDEFVVDKFIQLADSISEKSQKHTTLLSRTDPKILYEQGT